MSDITVVMIACNLNDHWLLNLKHMVTKCHVSFYLVVVQTESTLLVRVCAYSLCLHF